MTATTEKMERGRRFRAKLEEHREELQEQQESYMLCFSRLRHLEAIEREAEREILSRHHFRCGYDFMPEYEIGDRITDPDDADMMEDDELEEFCELVHQQMKEKHGIYNPQLQMNTYRQELRQAEKHLLRLVPELTEEITHDDIDMILRHQVNRQKMLDTLMKIDPQNLPPAY